MQNELLTTAQAAEVLGASPQIVRRQIAAGRLDAERVGRDWLVERGEVERFAALQRRGGRPRKSESA